MSDPIDLPLRIPQGGWPKALVRLELSHPCTKYEAVYEIACASRLMRRGVVVHYNGVDLFAFPHEEVSQIDRRYDRLRESPSASPPVLVERWTPLRKLEVVTAIATGSMKRATALEVYGLSEDELQGWEEGFQTNGIGGLTARHLREARR